MTTLLNLDEKLQNRHFILVGGSGFIGRNLTQFLLTRGADVAWIERESGLQEISGRTISIFAPHEVPQSLRQQIQKIDVVFLSHAGARGGMPARRDDLLEDNWAWLQKVRKDVLSVPAQTFFFFSSGGSVYGNCERDIPLSEDFPLHAVSPYGWVKAALEKKILDERDLWSPRVFIGRPANAYGAGQIPFSGQGLLPTLAASIILDRNLDIFGIEAIRDYVHVGALSESVIRLIATDIDGGIFNIGTGKGLSTQTVIQLFEDFMKKKVKMTVQERRETDVLYNTLDTTKLQRATQWSPVLELRERIGEIVDFVTKHLQGPR